MTSYSEAPMIASLSKRIRFYPYSKDHGSKNPAGTRLE
jgi:hypothetical protein